MRKIFYLLGVVFLSSSCVELPNLLPDGDGNQVDMVIIEVNYQDEASAEDIELIINDSIIIKFFNDYTPSNPPTALDSNLIEVLPNNALSINNGQLLREFTNTNLYSGLSNGALLGNATLGVWESEFKYGEPFITSFGGFLINYNIVLDKDVYVGFRFKSSNNKWHYGWLLFNHVAFGNDLFLKKIGYNKLPGVNVRIGD